MRLLILAVSLCLCLGVIGCSQSAKIAQDAFDRSDISQDELNSAMFVKAWGMTRIAGSEANGRAVSDAKVAMLRAQIDNTLTPAKVEQIINDLNTRISENEPYVSKSFAWLAYLLQQNERASAMRGNVDFFLQSQHPIGEQLSSQVPGSVDDIKASYANWEPVLGPMKREAQKLIAAIKGVKITDSDSSVPSSSPAK